MESLLIEVRTYVSTYCSMLLCNCVVGGPFPIQANVLLEESGPPSPRVVEIYIELCKFVDLKDPTVSG